MKAAEQPLGQAKGLLTPYSHDKLEAHEHLQPVSGQCTRQAWDLMSI